MKKTEIQKSDNKPGSILEMKASQMTKGGEELPDFIWGSFASAPSGSRGI